MLLYGNPESGHSYKVRSFLLLAGVAHEYRVIDLATPRDQRPADFRAASKFGEVPALVDSGRSLVQSNAILVHLSQKFNAFNGGFSDWQTVLEWLSWEANRVGFSVSNLRYHLLWAPQPPDVIAWLRARAAADLATLDGFLASSEFLLRSGPTIADISNSAYLFWLSQAGIEISEYPNVQRWLSSISALPRWQPPSEAMKAQAA